MRIQTGPPSACRRRYSDNGGKAADFFARGLFPMFYVVVFVGACVRLQGWEKGQGRLGLISSAPRLQGGSADVKAIRLYYVSR